MRSEANKGHRKPMHPESLMGWVSRSSTSDCAEELGVLDQAWRHDLRTAARGPLARSRAVSLAASPRSPRSRREYRCLQRLRSVLLAISLPFPDSGRLVRIFEQRWSRARPWRSRYPELCRSSAGARLFSLRRAYRPTAGLALTGRSARPSGSTRSWPGELPRHALACARAAGALLPPEEDRRGGDPVVVISHAAVAAPPGRRPTSARRR